jgi:hypothetical protein
MQIERASIADLDWALANMDGAKTRRSGRGGGNELVFDADPKGNKDEARFLPCHSSIFVLLMYV